MAKIIVTYNEVADLNNILLNKGLSCKVHMHDLCGSQSFTAKSTDENAEIGQYDTVKSEIKKYFEDKGMILRFAENDIDFVIYQS